MFSCSGSDNKAKLLGDPTPYLSPSTTAQTCSDENRKYSHYAVSVVTHLCKFGRAGWLPACNLRLFYVLTNKYVCSHMQIQYMLIYAPLIHISISFFIIYWYNVHSQHNDIVNANYTNWDLISNTFSINVIEEIALWDFHIS